MRKTVRLYTTTRPHDEGTIVVFDGEVYGGGSDGMQVRIAVEHRMAPPIVDALKSADPDERVLIEAEDWQIVG